MPVIKKIFTKKAIIKFNSDGIGIELYAVSNEILVKLSEFRFDEIRHYKIGESTTDDSSVLKLHLRNGTNVTYTFFETRYR